MPAATGASATRPGAIQVAGKSTTKSAPAAPAPVAVPPGETKQALLIALLSRTQGASIAELAGATGWQNHSVRGAISFALKKKLSLTITSMPDHSRGRVYRIGNPVKPTAAAKPTRAKPSAGKAQA